MVDANLNVNFQKFLEGKSEFKGDKKELLLSETKQASQKWAPPMTNKSYAIESVTVILELQRTITRSQTLSMVERPECQLGCG